MKAVNEEMMPKRARLGDAGYDICSPEEYDIKPGEWTVIDTGLQLDGTEYPYFCHQGRPIPNDGGLHTVQVTYPTTWFIAIFPRSGLSFKYGMRIINTIPVVDMGYRDSIKLKITSEIPFHISQGERIAQMVFLPYCIMSGEMTPTGKREGGFGSTGRM